MSTREKILSQATLQKKISNSRYKASTIGPKNIEKNQENYQFFSVKTCRSTEQEGVKFSGICISWHEFFSNISGLLQISIFKVYQFKFQLSNAAFSFVLVTSFHFTFQATCLFQNSPQPLTKRIFSDLTQLEWFKMSRRKFLTQPNKLKKRKFRILIMMKIFLKHKNTNQFVITKYAL